MLEEEAKFLEIPKADVIERLRAAGATEIYHGQILAHYYDFPDSRIRREGMSLRLRIKDATGDVALTGKKKLSEKVLRICEEIEDERQGGREAFDTIDQILTKFAGLKRYRVIEKERITYVLGEIRFEIDTIMQPTAIPTLLEIEGKLIDVKKGAKIAGVSMFDAKPWSTRRTLKYYQQQEG